VLDAIWEWFLDVTALFVIPDWGALIALIPIAIMAMVLVWIIWMIRKFRTQPRARRGKAKVPQGTPAGIHMPGPSFAPIFAAIGAALLFLGLVWGGWILWLGILALVLTLLYWLAEGIRLYDHDVGPSAPALPAVIHDGPPEGVHMPGPSFRPIVGAVGMGILFLGIVWGGWLLVAGVIALIVTLVGWLVDAVAEYRRTVDADRTGHLENGPAPRTPSLLLSLLLVVLAGGVLLQTGLLPPGKASAEPGASGAPGSAAPSGAPAPSGGPAPTGAPASGAPPASADVSITAQNIAFTQTTFTAKADQPFTIAFDNQDAGTPHDIEIKDQAGKVLFNGEIFTGVATKIYQVPALPAGVYPFVCSVHSNMTGTATIN
jgi:plastocyanin